MTERRPAATERQIADCNAAYALVPEVQRDLFMTELRGALAGHTRFGDHQLVEILLTVLSRHVIACHPDALLPPRPRGVDRPQSPAQRRRLRHGIAPDGTLTGVSGPQARGGVPDASRSRRGCLPKKPAIRSR